jgi:hypothetical protein
MYAEVEKPIAVLRRGAPRRGADLALAFETAGGWTCRPPAIGGTSSGRRSGGSRESS